MTIDDLIAARNARRAARIAAKKTEKRDAKSIEAAKPLDHKPGDVLTEMIRAMTKKPPCARFCKATAEKMNSGGVAWCRNHVDELGEEIHNNVKRMKWTDMMSAGLKAVDIVGHAASGNMMYCGLVIRACDECDRRNVR